jgi:hypothetical protein
MYIIADQLGIFKISSSATIVQPDRVYFDVQFLSSFKNYH